MSPVPHSISPWVVTNRPPATPVYGLLRLASTLHCSEPIDGIWVELNFGGVTQRFAASDIATKVGEAAWELAVLANSHLVPNGVVNLRVTTGIATGPFAEMPGLELLISNQGTLADSVRADLLAHGSPVLIAGHVDSAMYPFSHGQSVAWFNQPDAIAAAADVPLSVEPAADAEAAIQHLIRWGFTVLHEAVPIETVTAFNNAVEAALLSGRLLHRPGSSERIHDAHRLPEGRKIWLFPPVLDFLKRWFRDDACACQTLLYVNGSQQDAHQDTIHLTPYPAGYMCGVWVALEDVRPESGELFVYPGSHRTPRLLAEPLGLAKVTSDYSSYVVFGDEINRLLNAGGFERLVYRPKAGQILVWHENLIHGGGIRVNSEITRRSIVSHYYARGGVGFYDSRGEAAYLETLD
ncbi:phytanoyl-CoA dioxygenase family protein [Nitrospirillum amazonense]|uniref:Ectoine hydroxylase-related dioxygenase (Phytanoyl-CoA dioxygenase family) n=1 Tax=Nitrospirillum amazonense TaxID=28077 RepID=A0A560JDP9_9PROT|nr:phytanoyl-CoA dioxygenase family protein [Nitrospirillum amazonense]MDG3438874.1 phytanoyl-CoA dioxygenase family protein [Nitrospirillum amazonense]TWB69323.1 ectoine hydroxylase-related dioxygenase (phytanoyl-CoA dioxygenase family) [Nitrospirillum amazonense]